MLSLRYVNLIIEYNVQVIQAQSVQNEIMDINYGMDQLTEELTK